MNLPLAKHAFIPEVRSKQASRVLLYAQLFLFDNLAICMAFVMSAAFWGFQAGAIGSTQLVLMMLVPFIGFALNNGVYTSSAISNPKQNAQSALLALFFAVCAVICVTYALEASHRVPRAEAATGLALSAILLIANRWLIAHTAAPRLQGGPLNELLIIDDLEINCDGIENVLHMRVIGIRPDLSDPVMPRRFGQLTKSFDRVIVACSPGRRELWAQLLLTCSATSEIVMPEFDRLPVVGVGAIAGHSTHIVSRGKLSTTNRIKKRTLDLAVTVPAIILLSPLLLIIAVAIKIETPGPVLFRQKRVGRNNQLFDIFKFRSMRDDRSDPNGDLSTARGDDRITRVGQLIRATSIDELPQLFNVLIGDMSLVGPRPHALGSLAGDQLFWEIDQKYWERHALKPGITGLAQVRGFRGATALRSDLTQRLDADLEYLNSWTLGREFRILLATVAVLIHRNAF
jgi:polysaccharide biosynthesis protein PslA